MADIKTAPYVCHVFVCTNDRGGSAKSCADGQSSSLRQALKTKVRERGLKGRVRISQGGCMGLCADGPNVIIYPQKIWFSKAALEDADDISDQVEKLAEQ